MSNFADSLYRSVIVNKTVKKWNGYANGYAMGMQITRFFFLSFDIYIHENISRLQENSMSYPL